jgi:hypothetical protein
MTAAKLKADGTIAPPASLGSDVACSLERIALRRRSASTQPLPMSPALRGWGAEGLAAALAVAERMAIANVRSSASIPSASIAEKSLSA